MAVAMEGSFTAPADQSTVWAKLNDPEVLKACITGCQTMEKTDDTHFTATIRIKLGPVSATFKGRLELHDVDAPNGCRIVAEGAGGLVGFGNAAADIRLRSIPEGTMVTYRAEAHVGGRVARISGRLIAGAARMIADRFFARFAAAVALSAAVPDSATR